MARNFVAVDSPSFPAALAQLGRAPLGLWIDGALPDARGVAVVGTRAASPAGLAAARAVAGLLAARGIVVWSGGARGIDQAAHGAALDAGGVTVVCAPSGLSSPYPPGCDALWARAAERGAVLSLVPPDEKPRQHRFHARNAVLAAMTSATVLIEAPLDSGARSTTAHARRLRRPVLALAQPFGGPFAATAREEARLGATLVHDLAHLADALALCADPRGGREPARQLPLLSEPAARVLGALTSTPAHADALAARTGLSASALAVAALELVVSGAAIDEPGRGLRVS